MKKLQTTNRSLSALILILLIAVTAFSAVGCGKEESPIAEKEFTFEVFTASGETKSFKIKTERQKVGEALVDEGLIEGENGPYGLYVKTVDGETLDYEKDGMYWSFYVGETYGISGVDTTDIEEGKVYSFRAEKG